MGPANSYHIVKWCTWFAKRNHEVHVISFFEGIIPCAKIHLIDVQVEEKDSDIAKLKYLLTGKRIKEYIDEIKPDIVNAHYATSYGTALALSGVKNYVLSVWGADVYDFPKKSVFHRMMVEYSLNKATYLFSTSNAMAKEASKYTEKKFFITPFGVDTVLFNPNKRTRNRNDGDFVVGTVKSLKDKYGITYILRAVAQIKVQGSIPIKLRIAGKGPKEQEYKRLAEDLGISDITTWLGFISQEEAAKEWANMDVAVVPSTLESESFGVSAVEAQACGTAVIISDIPGLMEATSPGRTSLVVKRSNEHELAQAIIALYSDKTTRLKMGSEGVVFVNNQYSIDSCFSKIEEFFVSIA